MPSNPDQVRLQKVIARSGITSRRKAETLIQQGQVTVNGAVVTTLGTCVNPARDHVKVSGRHLKPQPPDIFLMLHKPTGCVSTMSDPLNRPTIAHYLDKRAIRVFPVGRLDYDTEGLLLLTNNGAIAQACLHPRHSVPKTYLAKIKGALTDQEISQLKHGLVLQDGPTAPARVRKVQRAATNSWIELTIHEGRKHQVKRMLESIKHPVIKLKRIRFGPLYLGDLLPGRYRHLTDREANALRDLPAKRTSFSSGNNGPTNLLRALPNPPAKYQNNDRGGQLRSIRNRLTDQSLRQSSTRRKTLSRHKKTPHTHPPYQDDR